MQCTDSDSTLPSTFDADAALMCSQLAMGLAYQEDVGLRLENALRIKGSPMQIITVGTSNIAFAKTRGEDNEELIIVNRGTIIKNVDDAVRNISGQVRTDRIFVGKRSGGEITMKNNGPFSQLSLHRQYLDRAKGPPQLFPVAARRPLAHILCASLTDRRPLHLPPPRCDAWRIPHRRLQEGDRDRPLAGRRRLDLPRRPSGGLRRWAARAQRRSHRRVEVDAKSSSVYAFTLGNASTLSITLDQDAEQFVVKWSGAWTYEKRWDVSSALLWRNDGSSSSPKETRIALFDPVWEAAAPDGPVRVYAFSPTKISNPAFETWIHKNVPSTFNFIMRFDPIAQMARDAAVAPPHPLHETCRETVRLRHHRCCHGTAGRAT